MAGSDARNAENRRICGAVVTRGKSSWVCVRPPHYFLSTEATFDPDTQTFALEPPRDGIPEWDRHYMVRLGDYTA